MFAKTLEGIRVIDATSVLAGPFASYQLAMLGADVIKIENPRGGDWARAGGPEVPGTGLTAQFVAQNAGKRSVTLDLSDPRGAAIAKRLVSTADVFLENFAPGTMARYGLDYDTLVALQPRLVYCSISGYGQTGPAAQRPAYDHVIQAASGLMSLVGTPETAPQRVGPPVIDYVSGLYGAFALLAALRERDRTGQPQRVDVAMLDCALSAMASFGSSVLNADHDPQPTGNTAASGSPASGIFDTAAGKLALAANQEKQVVALLRVMGLGRLLDDPRFGQPAERGRHRDAFAAALQARFLEATAKDWEARLSDARVPASQVHTLRSALASPQAQVRESYVPVRQGERELRVAGIGFRLNGSAIEPPSPPPTLSADTQAVLAMLGIGAEEAAQLRAAGVT